jgi:hypothetical protein
VESDVSYFRRRASEERTAALQAQHSEARQVHTDMAERYEDLVRAMIERDNYFGLSSLQDPSGRTHWTSRANPPTNRSVPPER